MAGIFFLVCSVCCQELRTGQQRSKVVRSGCQNAAVAPAPRQHDSGGAITGPVKKGPTPDLQRLSKCSLAHGLTLPAARSTQNAACIPMVHLSATYELATSACTRTEIQTGCAKEGPAQCTDLKLRSSATRLTSAKSPAAKLQPSLLSASLHCARRARIWAAKRYCSGTEPGCSTNLQAHIIDFTPR